MTKEQMWSDLLALWALQDDFDPYDWRVAQYYQTKFEIARRLRPKSICEIGVRAGYSAFAFLCGAQVPYPTPSGMVLPRVTYGGIDNNCDNNPWQTAHALFVLDKFLPQITMYAVDSQKMETLHTHADFVHVDGDHSFDGAVNDIKLALTTWDRRFPRYVLVDDYDAGAEVRHACDTITTWPDIASVYIDDGLRGSLLLWRTL